MDHQQSLIEFIGWIAVAGVGIYFLTRLSNWWGLWKYTAGAEKTFNALSWARSIYLLVFFGLVAVALVAAWIKGGPLW